MRPQAAQWDGRDWMLLTSLVALVVAGCLMLSGCNDQAIQRAAEAFTAHGKAMAEATADGTVTPDETKRLEASFQAMGSAFVDALQGSRVDWGEVLSAVVAGAGIALGAARVLPNRFLLGAAEAAALERAATPGATL